MFAGTVLSVKPLANGIAELCFDRPGDAINKFDKATLAEFQQALTELSTATDVKGLLLTSAKDSFIVGADIGEFGEMFAQTTEALIANLEDVNFNIFNLLEDLPFPTVAAINGIALGGGLEVALACDFRVLSDNARVGLPETQLGIFPGFGGTVRLPRLIGVDNAVDWIASGKEKKAALALKDGVADAVVAGDLLRDAALDIISKAIAGDFNWQANRAAKKAPLLLNDIESLMAFETCKAVVGQAAGRNYPAPLAAVNCIQEAAKLDRDGALKVEAKNFAAVAKTEVAKQLINLFLGDQLLVKTAKGFAKAAEPVQQAAVLGAGIMGGGIAYQSAYTGTPIIMKDIAQAGIDLGVTEATKLLSKLEAKGKINSTRMAQVLNSIHPALDYHQFGSVDMVVEAVVENPKVKHAVLTEVESVIPETAILASNTSTISIDFLAQPLKRPENFLGMHFFNPVNRMPLVEVIRGSKTSDAAVAKTVSYALAMGKKPVVVKDCAGFLVNRVLFPYFAAFTQLLHQGADFVAIDKVMEKFGWPMGPAYLLDVVGMDTAHHAASVVAEAYPDRMKHEFQDAVTALYQANRYGQKNGKGFYQYVADKKGRVGKVADESVAEFLAPICGPAKEFSADEICERLMIAFCLESVRCLEEGIAASPTDLDMAMIYGVGFPPFRGGPIRYLETIGVAEFVKLADKYAEHGGLFKVTDQLRAMAAAGKTFY
ncbi:fatty acid oxidation complex subunit alpha FadB [Halioxenophilus sp. WMMB6]|uniref:fatty acid oxidation complex subunit alpha FadB n=1 Tax=Halioxenophilus sp. WMMB6 TaxID=3073815 RepID=UPI00295F5750|nr:fatty acid oxidation complex subunit alpha FadB [Halioxenophilus sp. WMMB6]